MVSDVDYDLMLQRVRQIELDLALMKAGIIPPSSKPKGSCPNNDWFCVESDCLNCYADDDDKPLNRRG